MGSPKLLFREQKERSDAKPHSTFLVVTVRTDTKQVSKPKKGEKSMKKRQRLNQTQSRKLFTKRSGTHPKNIINRIMRGGYRL